MAIASKIAAVAAATACIFSTVANAETLRVGSLTVYAPFEFLDSNTGRYEGFDMDLIREIGKRENFDIEIVSMSLDGLVPALISGNIDAAVSALTITPERAARVDFTKPYYTAGLSMLVRKADAQKYPDFKALENQRIAVQIGTTGADTAKGIKGAKVAAFNTTSEAFMDLATGNSAAVVHDRPVLAYFLKTQTESAGTMQLQPEILDAQSYGFAVRKGNKELLDKLNKAYDELVASGEVQKIHDKWFAQ